VVEVVASDVLAGNRVSAAYTGAVDAIPTIPSDYEVMPGPSYLNGYEVKPNFGYPSALVSNPVLEADDSSPWLQNRVVCERPDLDFVEPIDTKQGGLLGQVLSIFRFEANSDAEVVDHRHDPRVFVDLGSGATATLPIGTLMPLRRGWRWRPSDVTGPDIEIHDYAPADVGLSSSVLRTPEPEWNEADDEMPSWVTLDGVECRSGALMGRRRSHTGD
jgi:hypothetical protein